MLFLQIHFSFFFLRHESSSEGTIHLFKQGPGVGINYRQHEVTLSLQQDRINTIEGLFQNLHAIQEVKKKRELFFNIFVFFLNSSLFFPSFWFYLFQAQLIIIQNFKKIDPTRASEIHAKHINIMRRQIIAQSEVMDDEIKKLIPVRILFFLFFPFQKHEGANSGGLGGPLF